MVFWVIRIRFDRLVSVMREDLVMLESLLQRLAQEPGICCDTSVATCCVKYGADSVVVKAQDYLHNIAIAPGDAAIKAFFPCIRRGLYELGSLEYIAAKAGREFNLQQFFYQQFAMRGIERMIPQPLGFVPECSFSYEAHELPFCYIAMEWKGRYNLQGIPYELHPRLVLSIIEQLALFIDTIHAEGYLYLDLKPDNVRIDTDMISVVDFGAIRSIAELSVDEKPFGWNIGTVGYDAPERMCRKIINNKEAEAFTEPTASRQSDLFSLGAVAYFLFEMKEPYDEQQEYDYKNGVRRALVMEEELGFSFTPKPLIPIILKAMHENPDERFASGMAFYHAMRDASHSSVICHAGI